MCFGGPKKAPKEEVDVEQEEQKAAAEEEKKSEAEKAADVKEKAMEAKSETFTAPVSTLDKDSTERRRQKELSQDIEAPSTGKGFLGGATEGKGTLTGDALAGAMTSMLGKKEGGPFEGPPSKAPKRKQKQSDLISGLSKKRSKGRGRRSLITGKSGGGIGYYSRFFT